MRNKRKGYQPIIQASPRRIASNAIEPAVTDRVDAVSEAGASEMMREVNIRKRFALLYHFSTNGH